MIQYCHQISGVVYNLTLEAIDANYLIILFTITQNILSLPILLIVTYW